MDILQKLFESSGFGGDASLVWQNLVMFTIGGGTAQILRTLVASQILGRKLPQTRDGYVKMAEGSAKKAKKKGYPR